MAAVTGTSSSYSVGSGGGIREDLEDVIWDLFPEDTWALSNLDRVDASNTYHEWQNQELAANGANRQLEGDDPTFATAAAPTRVGNYLQISRKEFIVSGTLEAVKKAGRKSEIARVAMVKMRELKRDMEHALVRNQASSAGGAATARSTASMESWIAGTTEGPSTAANAVAATTTANAATTPGFSSGTVAAPTDGSTTGTITETALKSALQGAWEDGGDPRVILVSATQKKNIDTFTGVATRFVDVGRSNEASIIGAANLYVSDFGRHQVILHRYMRTSVVLCIDPDFWAVAYLRRPFQEKLAKSGDAQKFQLLAEYGLVARNYKASSKVVACA